MSCKINRNVEGTCFMTSHAHGSLLAAVSLGALTLGVGSPAHSQIAPSAITEGPAETIVVTGTRTQRRVENAPVRTDILSERAIERTGARSLADALDYLPGAYSENNCQNCNTVEIKLLGLGSAYSAILLDSRPLISTLGEVYGLDQFAPIAVERIEVVKGGAGALYGADAVAGVINVIPHRPHENALKATGDVDVIDGEPQFVAGLLGERIWDGGSVLLTAQHNRLNPVDLNGDGFTELGDRIFWQGGGILRFTPTETDTISFDASILSEERRGGDSLDRPPHEAQIAEAIDSTFAVAGARWERRLGETGRFMAQAAFARAERDSYYGGVGDTALPGTPGFDAVAYAAAVEDAKRLYGTTLNDVRFLEAQLDWTLGAHAMTAGVQWKRETIDDRNVDLSGALISVLQDSDVKDLGVYLQDEWSVSGAVTLLAGVRIDDNSLLEEAVVSPRVGLLWRPTETLTVRANVSTGFRAPEAFSEDFHVDTLGAEPVRVINAPGLAAEKARTVALGFDYAPAPGLRFDAQVYSTELSDSFVVGAVEQLGDGSLVQVRRNGSGATVSGAEAGVQWRVGNGLTLQAGAAYVDATFDRPETVFGDEGAGDAVAITRFLKTPSWTGVLSAVWEPVEGWELAGSVRHIGRMDALNNNTGVVTRTDPFWVVDLIGSRELAIGDRPARFRVGVKNLLDEYQSDLETGPGRDSDYVYGPRAPRTFTAGFSFGF
jgi:outer membrane receptor for ferrienterochelin and colicins